jgi:hypothetical protein
MALNSFVTGPYTATFNSLDPGYTENGWDLSINFKRILIDKTDVYGDTVIDMIERGIEPFISAVFRQYGGAAGTAAVTSAFYPGTVGVNQAVGVLSSTLVKTLVLTAIAGTTAATTNPATGATEAGPSTLTSTGAIVVENANSTVNFGSVNRDVPVRFRLLPYSSSGIRFFSCT